MVHGGHASPLLAQLEVDMIKSLERDDLLRFYDYYISPHSAHRRKLALHVTPSPLALQAPNTEADELPDDDESAIVPGDEDIQAEREPASEISSDATKLTEQPTIIDTRDSQDRELTSPEKQLHLPKVRLSDSIRLLLTERCLFSLGGMDR